MGSTQLVFMVEQSAAPHLVAMCGSPLPKVPSKLILMHQFQMQALLGWGSGRMRDGTILFAASRRVRAH